MAALPLLLGLHQLTETLVWWGLQGTSRAVLGEVAMWIYLLFAFVALPVLVPGSCSGSSPGAAGVADRVVRRARHAVGPGSWSPCCAPTPTARDEPGSTSPTRWASTTVSVVAGLYVLATCGAMLASGLRHVVWFGFANLVAVVVLARLSADGFPSLWCFYAALASGAIALYMRIGETRHGEDELGDRPWIRARSRTPRLTALPLWERLRHIKGAAWLTSGVLFPD